MVWRGFSVCGQIELTFLRGKRASKYYIKTIFSILTNLLRFTTTMTLMISVKIHLKGDDFFFLGVMEWASCSAPKSYR